MLEKYNLKCLHGSARLFGWGPYVYTGCICAGFVCAHLYICVLVSCVFVLGSLMPLLHSSRYRVVGQCTDSLQYYTVYQCCTGYREVAASSCTPGQSHPYVNLYHSMVHTDRGIVQEISGSPELFPHPSQNIILSLYSAFNFVWTATVIKK